MIAGFLAVLFEKPPTYDARELPRVRSGHEGPDRLCRKSANERAMARYLNKQLPATFAFSGNGYRYAGALSS
jgi:hypothetical protein